MSENTGLTAIFDEMAQQVEARVKIDDAKIESMVERVLAKNCRRIEVVRDGKPIGKIENAHQAAERVLTLLTRDFNAGQFPQVHMYGPAGSGKSTLAKHTAEALGLPLISMQFCAGTTESAIVGRVKPLDGGYIETAFWRNFDTPCMMFFDELHSADPGSSIILNSMLAQGTLTNPLGETKQRDRSCYIMSAGNSALAKTSAQYAAAQRQDGSTADRFAGRMVHIDYDQQLEREIVRRIFGEGRTSEADDLCCWYHAARARLVESRLQRALTTRGLIAAAIDRAEGDDYPVIAAALSPEWSEMEISKVFPR